MAKREAYSNNISDLYEQFSSHHSISVLAYGVLFDIIFHLLPYTVQIYPIPYSF